MTRKTRVEENIRLIESGRLEIPQNADLLTFLLSDGRLSKQPVVSATLTLASLFEQFFNSIPKGDLERTTLDGMRIHERHLKRLIGDRFAGCWLFSFAKICEMQ